jgi:endonuclease/exonuclease/phosphatase family metal-dependent hydrolase
MPVRRLWLATWNMGNTAGADEELDNIAQTVPANTDLVVFGLQEAGLRGHILSRFAANLNNFRPPATLNNNVKAKRSMMGLTKPFQELPNSQRLGVWVANNRAAEVTVICSDSHRTSKSGKGAVIMILDFNGSRLAFVTAHLGTSANSREDEAVGIINRVNAYNARAINQGAPNRNINGIFLMGDLNYRLQIPTHDIQVARKFLGIRTGTKDKAESDLDSDQLARKLVTAEGRAELAQYDTLNHANWPNQEGFSFPLPERPDGSVAYPTYRRATGGGNNNPGCRLAAGAGTMLDRIRYATECYFGTTALPKVKEKRGNVIDLGWLDRIGFHNGPAYPNVVINPPHVYDIQETWSSDHAPVCMTTSAVLAS